MTVYVTILDVECNMVVLSCLINMALIVTYLGKVVMYVCTPHCLYNLLYNTYCAQYDVHCIPWFVLYICCSLLLCRNLSIVANQRMSKVTSLKSYCGKTQLLWCTE